MSQAATDLSPQLDEREGRINVDYEWVLHDPEVQRQYAGRVVAVHNRTIWGQGKTHLAALEAALASAACPPRGELTTVPVEGVPVSVQASRGVQ